MHNDCNKEKSKRKKSQRYLLAKILENLTVCAGFGSAHHLRMQKARENLTVDMLTSLQRLIFRFGWFKSLRITSFANSSWSSCSKNKVSLATPARHLKKFWVESSAVSYALKQPSTCESRFDCTIGFLWRNNARFLARRRINIYCLCQKLWREKAFAKCPFGDVIGCGRISSVNKTRAWNVTRWECFVLWVAT